jgi:hypothetical protein
MSWLFSQALVEASSEATCSDGEPCAPLSVMPTAHSFWRRGKTIESSRLSLFGLTCAVLTEHHGAELLTSYLQGFRAKTSARPARALGSTARTPASGGTPCGSFATWSPNTSGWKTAQCSLLAGSDESSVTWPRWGSMRSGACSERPTWVSHTTGSACGSRLPTPSGVNGGRNNTMGRVDEWGGSSNPLRGTVIGSTCSPEFEELVMGWPIGWTELTPYETGRFHEWRREHGECSARACREAA